MENIFLGHKVVDKCYAFAERVCVSYAAGRKENSRTLAVVGKPMIDQNREVQYVGRIAEFAVCVYLGIDPHKELNWTSKCDNGADFVFNGMSIDVKASNHPAATRLIWPVSKNHFLHSAADVFVFAKVPKDKADELGQVVSIIGCVSKRRFIAEAVKADKVSGLVDGTLFMDMKHLDPIAKLKQS